MVQRFSKRHTHTQTGARITRGLFASSRGRALTGGEWGKGDEPSPRRCDAMPMRHAGATRYFAFYGVHFGNRNRFIHILVFLFVFLVGFSFSCLSVLFVPIWAKPKKSENKHHMHSSSSLSSSYRKGVGFGWGGEGLEQSVLILVSSGGISGAFFPPCEQPVSFIPTLLLFFLQPTIPKTPPVLFPRQRTPTHALPRPRVPFPPPFIPPGQTRSRTRRDERREEKGWYFHPSGSGGTGAPGR